MENVTIIGEAVAGQEATVRRDLLRLTADIKKHTFDVAELLCQVQENKLHLKWKFESFPDYAERELGLKMRKAEYLSRIVRVCRECGIVRKDYEPAGITKLREITSLDPRGTYFNPETRLHEPMVDHIVRLIAEAPECTTVEVEEEVARLKGMTGENAMLTRSYKVTRSAYENTVKPALEAMRKLLGSKGRDGTGAAIEYPDGACFEYICREFLNDPRNFVEEEYVANQNQSTDCSASGSCREEDGDRQDEAAISVGIPTEDEDTLPTSRQIIPSE